MSNWHRVVSDTGPLITLEKLPDGYGFVRLLCKEIIIPPSVLREVSEGDARGSQGYLDAYGVADFLSVIAPQSGEMIGSLATLDEGERDAIRLSMSLRLPLLIEEEAGRKAARGFGLRISGIAGLVLRAVEGGLVSSKEGESLLRSMFSAGRISRYLLDALTRAIQGDVRD